MNISYVESTSHCSHKSDCPVTNPHVLLRKTRTSPKCLLSLILERAHFEWVLWIQNESNRDGQSNHNKISRAANENQEKKHVTGLSQARKSARDQIAVGVNFNASDWMQREGGARFLDQLQSEVHANLNSCGPGWLSTLIWKFPEYIKQHCYLHSRDGKEREQSLIQVLATSVFEAILVRPDKSAHSKLYTPQILQYHSSPAEKKNRTKPTKIEKLRIK